MMARDGNIDEAFLRDTMSLTWGDSNKNMKRWNPVHALAQKLGLVASENELLAMEVMFRQGGGSARSSIQALSTVTHEGHMSSIYDRVPLVHAHEFDRKPSPGGPGYSAAWEGGMELTSMGGKGDLNEGLLAMGEGEGHEGPRPTETRLMWQLAWPLLVGKVADEISTLLMFAYWGHLGGAVVLNSANLSYMWMQTTLVFIFGAQQAIYTMAPQSQGTNPKQVGVILQLVLFWTSCVLGVPTLLSWFFMGEMLEIAGLVNQTNPEEVASVEDFSAASAAYLLPYTAALTVTTWLESVEIVESGELIAGFWSLMRALAAFLLMCPFDGWVSAWGCPTDFGIGLAGYAYASAIAYTGQLVTTIAYVFMYRGLHKEYWGGWDIKATLNPRLNLRFIKLCSPMVIMYGLQNWANTIFQQLLSNYGEDEGAAYGVSTAFTNCASSVSLAMYIAVSVRTGTLLGENQPVRAMRAARLGMGYAMTAGAMIATGLYTMRMHLGPLFSDDPDVQRMVGEAAPAVCLYYFFNSSVWAAWAVLEGQMRTSLASTALLVGIWAVTVPGGWILFSAHANPWAPGLIYQLGWKPLPTLWWWLNVGEFVTWIIMFVAVLRSNWQALADEAVENAGIIEED